MDEKEIKKNKTDKSDKKKQTLEDIMVLAKKLELAIENNTPTYEIKIRCWNCGMGESIVPANQFTLKIPRGFSLDDYASIKGCPNCGCNLLKRVTVYG